MRAGGACRLAGVCSAPRLVQRPLQIQSSANFLILRSNLFQNPTILFFLNHHPQVLSTCFLLRPIVPGVMRAPVTTLWGLPFRSCDSRPGAGPAPTALMFGTRGAPCPLSRRFQQESPLWPLCILRSFANSERHTDFYFSFVFAGVEPQDMRLEIELT